MLIRHAHGVKDFSVDVIIIDIDQIHLLSDALEGSLLTETLQIGADETVRRFSHSLEVHIL